MGLIDLLREKVEKQMAALDEELQAAEAEAKARKARAEAEVAGAELEQELLSRVNELKEQLAEGQAYLKELADAGDEKADEIKARIARFFE
jgi:hypothetical protein